MVEKSRVASLETSPPSHIRLYFLKSKRSILDLIGVEMDYFDNYKHVLKKYILRYLSVFSFEDLTFNKPTR